MMKPRKRKGISRRRADCGNGRVGRKPKTYRSYDEFMEDFRKRMEDLMESGDEPESEAYRLGERIARDAWKEAERELEKSAEDPWKSLFGK